MKIVSASATVIASTPGLERLIERAGRVCYKSEDKITDDSHVGFLARLAQSKHESVLEHGSISVHFVVDRGVSHELVRHRIASFSQESTRYCNYSKGKFGAEITVIQPCFWDLASVQFVHWGAACQSAENTYHALLRAGATPQEARSVLPNSLKTELVMTANPREWLHVFKLRCAPTAHPQMREVMIPLRAYFAETWPAIFGTGVDSDSA
ncbi:MAG: FAD-dependent thymidylate synthase [Rhodoplanes sp.]|uniref:FAD-dependent thymidylate synthase n=1 Tax=Rhodoplanes sp. TaxID=1968906 RepID=UPI00184A8CB6|nr:FAD-dependent thymidylate synthase [Rhodoplanes sp.]NVO13839.1 FAD-dependent thymidylate synthase [Rhodoplanes sp.]